MSFTPGFGPGRDPSGGEGSSEQHARRHGVLVWALPGAGSRQPGAAFIGAAPVGRPPFLGGSKPVRPCVLLLLLMMIMMMQFCPFPGLSILFYLPGFMLHTVPSHCAKGHTGLQLGSVRVEWVGGTSRLPISRHGLMLAGVLAGASSPEALCGMKAFIRCASGACFFCTVCLFAALYICTSTDAQYLRICTFQSGTSQAPNGLSCETELIRPYH